MHVVRKLLWIDCLAAAVAGVTVVLLSGWLSQLHGLPREVLLFVGAVNLFYGSYSFSLAIRRTRTRFFIGLLVFANLIWAVACLGLVLAFAETISAFGVIHLVGESFFVGGLALLEWRWRAQLLVAS